MRKKENKIFETSHNKFLQNIRDFDRVCPKCKSHIVNKRIRKKPKYKCQKCKYEFDDPRDKLEDITLQQQIDYGRKYPNPDE